MKIHSFVSDSAADAVAQIRARLGPEAVVLNVRRLEGAGLARLWQRSRIEVLAHVPETESRGSQDGLEDLRQQLARIQQQVQVVARSASVPGAPDAPSESREARPTRPAVYQELQRLLQGAGVSQEGAAKIVDLTGETLAWDLRQEVTGLVRAASAHLDPALCVRTPCDTAVHVFVGPSGCGKTTVLSKWLARTVLMEGLPASVWRLDGRVANVAESLSIYCDILNVPLQRHAGEQGPEAIGGALFIDLPGVNPRDGDAMEDLVRRLEGFGRCTVHLVLNLAYDVNLLVEQARTFAACGVKDLIFTHMDEELRWGKAFDVASGTNFPMRFLSAGQNVPGQLVPAEAAMILAPQHSVRRAVAKR